jgi:hypothetical protein
MRKHPFDRPFRSRVSARRALRRGVPAALALAAALAIAPTSARASDAQQSAGAGLSLGAMGCTLVYGPAKLVYATLGTITSGLAYVFTGGDWSVGKSIFASSFYGDYIVTPEHLTGQKPLEFVGRAEPVERDVAAGNEGIPEPEPSTDGL